MRSTISVRQRAPMSWSAIAEHRAGRGARITREAVAAGIELIVARVWADAPRRYEQTLKNQGGARRICPVCKAEAEEAKGRMK